MCARAQIQPPPVDQASADRGQQLFTQQCAQCHGAGARGTATGPDLIRSLAVLHDRAQQLHGSELAPLYKKPDHTFDLGQEQVADLSQFLTRAVNKTLRSGYSNQPTLMLSGDAKAGEAYFNGDGGCNKCHSATGDLAGVGKMDPAALQQRFVFPESGIGGRGRGAAAAAPATPRPKTQATVTPPGGQAITGTLVRIDDFNVTLEDSSGAQRTFTRTAGMKVDVNDPYSAHVALLAKYTDADIHNLTAYLETLK
jgi:mono/diheme cytochrome c family protein